MKSLHAVRLRDLVGETLTLVQPSMWKRVFELRHGDDVVGTMTQKGWFGQEARVECADGCWTIRTNGWWKQTMSVTPCEEVKPVHSMQLRAFSRTITMKLPRYKTLTFKSNFWGSTYTLTSGMQQVILTLDLKKLSLRAAAAVTIDKKAEAFDELPWLVFTTLYLVMREQESRRGAR